MDQQAGSAEHPETSHQASGRKKKEYLKHRQDFAVSLAAIHNLVGEDKFRSMCTLSGIELGAGGSGGTELGATAANLATPEARHSLKEASKVSANELRDRFSHPRSLDQGTFDRMDRSHAELERLEREGVTA